MRTSGKGRFTAAHLAIPALLIGLAGCDAAVERTGSDSDDRFWTPPALAES